MTNLVLENVTKTVGGECHIRDVSLELDPGAPVVLLGRTLAGKTTLIRLMAGLDRPTSGHIVMDGYDVTHMPVRKRNVAMVYQQFINYPSFTVYENIAAPLRRAGLDKRDIDRKVRETAETLRIDGLLDRLPGELSGGQQQRTALARALVKEADLLLLDEPLINLDYKLREELRSELRSIFSGRDSVVVYATTEPLEALMLQGTTVVMAEGSVLQAGPTLEVFHHPASVDVGDVFSDPPMNMIAGRIEGGTATLGTGIVVPVEGHLAGLPPGPYRFGVRANHLFVVAETEGRIRFDAVVELAEISGSETFIHATHNGVSWVVQEEGVHSFSLDQPIQVYLSPRHLYAFDEAGRLAAAPVRDASAPNGPREARWHAST